MSVVASWLVALIANAVGVRCGCGSTGGYVMHPVGEYYVRCHDPECRVVEGWKP